MEIGNLLFFTGWNKPSLADAFRHQIATAIPKAVDQLSNEEFEDHSDPELIERVSAKVRINPLCLDLTSAIADAQETEIESQNVWGERGRTKGLRVTKAVPFSGDRELWKLYPNEYDMNPPRGDIQSGKLIVGMEVPDQQSDQAVAHIQNTLTKVQTYIDRQSAMIDQFNRELPTHIAPLVRARRGRLSIAANVLDKLK